MRWSHYLDGFFRKTGKFMTGNYRFKILGFKILLLMLLVSFSNAQNPLVDVLDALGIGYRGELGAQFETLLNRDTQQQAWTLDGRLELDSNLDYGSGDVQLTAVTAPRIVFSNAETVNEDGTTEQDFVRAHLGLTEVYGFTTLGAFDVSAGLERLPLEYARLSVPLNLEPILEGSLRRGLLGARASYFTGDWRLRGGLFYDGLYDDSSDELGGFASARRSFGNFELEAFGVYAGEPILGAGGSGVLEGIWLLEDIVVYGEAWWLVDSNDLRASFGATGNPAFGSWTVELSYLVPGLGSVKFDGADDGSRDTTATDPRPAVLGQLDWVIDNEHGLTVSGATFFDDDATRGQASIIYSNLGFEDQFTASITTLIGPEPVTVVGSVGVRYFF